MAKQFIVLKLNREVTLTTNGSEIFKVNINLKEGLTKKEFLKNIDTIEIVTKLKKNKK